MNKFFTITLYVMWTISLVGILAVTFSNFQYTDLNVIVGIFFIFTLINTFFMIREK